MNLTFKTHKSADVILDFLTDMQKFVSVHPVITHIKQTGENNYEFFETLKLGFIPFSFTYPVIIESNPANKTVVMRATIMKLTKIELTFFITTDKDFCVIEEAIHFKSPLPVKSIMQRIFKKQHTQLFKNIERL